jgi:hypothetical protein
MSAMRGSCHHMAVGRPGALAVAAAVAWFGCANEASAAQPSPIRIAVFDFELNDASAGGGIIVRDAVDLDNLTKSAEDARRLLSASGRYNIIDTGGVMHELTAAGGIQHCNGCEGALAKRLGADQAMVGIVTRINRTEYTLQIVIKDTNTGALVANHFTGLRMGANYAWPRGVKWLMDNRILAAQQVP